MVRWSVLVTMVAALMLATVSGAFAQRDGRDSQSQAELETEILESLNSVPHIARIFQDFPEQRERIVAELGQTIEQNGTEGLEDAVFRSMYDFVQSVTPYYMARARDQDLLAMYRSMLSVGQGLSLEDPIRCSSFYLGTTMPDGSIAMDLRVESVRPFANSLQLVTYSLFTHAGRNEVGYDAMQANDSIMAAGAALGAAVDQRTIDLVAQTQPIQSRDDHIKYCHGINVLFAEMLRLPQDEAVNLLRSF